MDLAFCFWKSEGKIFFNSILNGVPVKISYPKFGCKLEFGHHLADTFQKSRNMSLKFWTSFSKFAPLWSFFENQNFSKNIPPQSFKILHSWQDKKGLRWGL